MATRDFNIIVFVIIHGKDLHDGGFSWLSLILKKNVVSLEDPLKITPNTCQFCCLKSSICHLFDTKVLISRLWLDTWI